MNELRTGVLVLMVGSISGWALGLVSVSWAEASAGYAVGTAAILLPANAVFLAALSIINSPLSSIQLRSRSPGRVFALTGTLGFTALIVCHFAGNADVLRSLGEGSALVILSIMCCGPAVLTWLTTKLASRIHFDPLVINTGRSELTDEEHVDVLDDSRRKIVCVTFSTDIADLLLDESTQTNERLERGVLGIKKTFELNSLIWFSDQPLHAPGTFSIKVFDHWVAGYSLEPGENPVNSMLECLEAVVREHLDSIKRLEQIRSG